MKTIGYNYLVKSLRSSTTLLLLFMVGLSANAKNTYYNNRLDSISSLGYEVYPAKRMYDLMVDNQNIDPIKSMFYGMKLLQQPYINTLSKRKEYDIRFIIADQCYFMRYWYEEGIYILNEVTTQDSIMLAHRALYQGRMDIVNNNYSAGYELLNRAESLYLAYDHPNLTMLWGAKGFVHAILEEVDRSICYYDKAVESLNDKNASSSRKLLNGYCYTLFNALTDTIKQEYFDRIKYALDKFDYYSKIRNDTSMKFTYYFNYIKYAVFSDKNITTALTYIDSCRVMLPAVEQKFYHAEFFLYAAQLMAKPQVENYQLAHEYIQHAISILEESNFINYQKLLLQAYQLEGDIYYKIGKYPSMQKSYQKSNRILRDISKSISSHIAEEERMRTALLKAQNKTIQLNLKNDYLLKTRMWIGIGFILSIVLVGYILILYHANKDYLLSIENLNLILKDQIEVTDSRNEELLKLNNQLKTINLSRERLIERFQTYSSFIVHEFKEPLRTVGAFTSLLTSRLQDSISPKDNEYLRMLNIGAYRLCQVLNVLQQFNNNTITFLKDYARVDLNKVLEAAQNKIDNQVKEKKAIIVCQGHLPVVDGHYELLVQLFQHVLTNSLKYVDKGVRPRILICATAQDNSYKIEIIDNGVGISEGDEDMVFGLFRRSNNSSHIDGHGIGLAICKEIVEFHNGQISIENHELGGACLTLVLPEKQIDNPFVQSDNNKNTAPLFF